MTTKDTDAEGIWSIEFASTLHEHGCGALILEKGRALGCDPTHYYRGHYAVNNGAFTCTLVITHDRGQASAITDGTREIEVTVTGELYGNSIDLFATVSERPAERFVARLVRRADLP